MCIVLCSEGPVSLSCILSSSYTFSTSSNGGVREPQSEGFSEDIPFRTEDSKVSHNTHCPMMGLFLLPSTARGGFSDNG